MDKCGKCKGRYSTWLVAGLVLGTMGCPATSLIVEDHGNSLYLNYSLESREGDGAWTSHGGGCMAHTRNGSGASGTTAGGTGEEDYEIAFVSGDGQTQFTAIVKGEVVEERVFDRSFLNSGDEETVVVELPNGSTRRYTFWGSSKCEGPARPDEMDAGIVSPKEVVPSKAVAP